MTLFAQVHAGSGEHFFGVEAGTYRQGIEVPVEVAMGDESLDDAWQVEFVRGTFGQQDLVGEQEVCTQVEAEVCFHSGPPAAEGLVIDGAAVFVLEDELVAARVVLVDEEDAVRSVDDVVVVRNVFEHVLEVDLSFRMKIEPRFVEEEDVPIGAGLFELRATKSIRMAKYAVNPSLRSPTAVTVLAVSLTLSRMSLLTYSRWNSRSLPCVQFFLISVVSRLRLPGVRRRFGECSRREVARGRPRSQQGGTRLA